MSTRQGIKRPGKSKSKIFDSHEADHTPCLYYDKLYCASPISWHMCQSCEKWPCVPCADVPELVAKGNEIHLPQMCRVIILFGHWNFGHLS
jgi:hypothetical protein